MKFHISYPALGLALVAGAPAANAQTVITRQIADQPVETVIQEPAATVVAQAPLVTAPAATVVQPAAVVQPVQTVQTTETIRTVRPVRRQIVTTRTVTRRIVPAPGAPIVVARTVTTAPQPLYDTVVTPAPLATVPQPLYDEVVSAPAVAAPVISAPVVNTAPVIYRYVYQPDRILVVDPNTGIAVQAIPR